MAPDEATWLTSHEMAKSEMQPEIETVTSDLSLSLLPIYHGNHIKTEKRSIFRGWGSRVVCVHVCVWYVCVYVFLKKWKTQVLWKKQCDLSLAEVQRKVMVCHLFCPEPGGNESETSSARSLFCPKYNWVWLILSMSKVWQQEETWPCLHQRPSESSQEAKCQPKGAHRSAPKATLRVVFKSNLFPFDSQ
jgi:hypothetical protein